MTNTWLQNHIDRGLSKHVFGKLLTATWESTASVRNAVNGFKSCGLYPIDQGIVVDDEDAFTPAETSERAEQPQFQDTLEGQMQPQDGGPANQSQAHNEPQMKDVNQAGPQESVACSVPRDEETDPCSQPLGQSGRITVEVDVHHTNAGSSSFKDIATTNISTAKQQTKEKIHGKYCSYQTILPARTGNKEKPTKWK